jgi:ABC-type multidrug transport system fused ATPase/permease subunit
LDATSEKVISQLNAFQHIHKNNQLFKAVQKALEAARRTCTCIQVAHRLSSIRNADKIIVLVDGEIAEIGTHAELVAEKGLYYEMNQMEM